MTDTLTAAALEAMEPREIDALVAERVMGCKPEWEPDEKESDCFCVCERCVGEGFFRCEGGSWIRDYSTSHDACAEVLARVAEMDKPASFMTELWRVFLRKQGFVSEFDLVNATPRQKCEAALLAVEASRDM